MIAAVATPATTMRRPGQGTRHCPIDRAEPWRHHPRAVTISVATMAVVRPMTGSATSGEDGVGTPGTSPLLIALTSDEYGA